MIGWLRRRRDLRRMAAETVFPRRSAVEEAESRAASIARFTVAERWPYGPILWSDWRWTDLPTAGSQFWPTAAARRA